MKLPVGLFLSILAVSLLAWMAVYLFLPGPTLDAPETMVLVGACALAVLLCRWIWGHLRKPSGEK